MASMSSTLVETVSINYEDFNESFLTCGTCLCTYDGGEHTPKLLPCSHTVCLHCLTRIAASQTRDSGTFRCPICRELITIPRGGVPALPPSFLVNQLLDLMARQRREVIPQCSSHPGRELLFCETCDCVFCRHCADGPHSDTPCDHTVVPFSIALKRMSEILLYRANECLSKLGSAREAVAGELRRLEAATAAADEAIDRQFSELKASIEKRHSELKAAAAAAATHKRRMLEEQLKLIDNEKAKVEAECSGLQQQVEVREVSTRAATLSARLGDATALSEPRENAFLAVDFGHNDALQRFAEALVELGRVRTSTTFPGLCTLTLESVCVCGLEISIALHTIDYHGEERRTGGDPVSAAATLDDAPLPCTVTDLDSGIYRGRTVRARARVRRGLGRGAGKEQLSQPVAVARCPKRREIYVLDAGNSRVKVLDDETFAFKSHITNEGLAGRSCTGLAVTADGFLVVNWRTRTLTEVSPDGTTLRVIRSERLVEPVAVACDAPSRRVAVADNGARTVFVFDQRGDIVLEVGEGQLGLVGGVALSEELLVVADSAVRVYGPRGELRHTLANVPKGRGGYGGVALDVSDSVTRVVCVRSVRGRPSILVLDPSGVGAGGGGPGCGVLAACELAERRPRRVAGLALLPKRRALLADLAADCLRLYTYW
ncbi:Tripartite motif-containing protein 2 [Eumeta japonica]|uniref:Tripartite motif-containing protein 2 n=1 Tax=Eumeta variegata TaxID=151549 RepID=A0A4C1ZPM4_EUMVA|nr:Tripartite motif-containing protein 2 [Eumeta japonica]